MNERLHEPPERDTSVPRTPEEKARQRGLIWLIIKVVVALVVIVLFISFVSSCYRSMVRAGGAVGEAPTVAVSTIGEAALLPQLHG